MPSRLKRYYGANDLHFITCSCHQRRPFLDSPERRDLLLNVLEQVRLRYVLVVLGYVVMPEHIHLLITEPQIGTVSTVMQALKIGFARRVVFSEFGSRHFVPNFSNSLPHFSHRTREMGHPRVGHPLTIHPQIGHMETRNPLAFHLWQKRFYDFNVWTDRKRVEKLRYIHRNPVSRGLVARPEDWRWSSLQSYANGEAGVVHVNEWEVLKLRVRSVGAT